MKTSRIKIILRDTIEISIFVAIAVVLDTFIKIPISFTGGSINFSLVPLIIISLRHGPLKGFIASGIVYSLITCLLDGYGIITFPFDYFIAFGSIAITGLYSKKLNEMYKDHMFKTSLIVSLLILISGIIRVLSSSINSVMLYDVTYIAGIIYNITYVLPSIGIDIIITIVLLPLVIIFNKRYKTTFLM